MSKTETLPLPKSWTTAVRSAMLQVIALTQFALACAEAKVTRKRRSAVRAENDRLRQELELTRQELRIKDARMSRLAPQKRPHYLPTERMAILQLRAARGWSVAQAAAAFGVTTLTISDWMLRLETEGTERFVALAEPVNKFPDFVQQAVQQVKALCPRLGKRKIAEMLARAGLHLGATTVRRMLREFPKPRPKPQPAAESPTISAYAANEVWHADLTIVPTLLGFWTSWLPQALPQSWPFCYWAAVVIDHHSRRIQGIQCFDKQPTSREVREFLSRTIRLVGTKPRYLVVDKGVQFWSRGFKSWCRRRGIRPRFGAIGQSGSLALIERLIRTLKSEFTSHLILPIRRNVFQRQLESFAVWFNGYRPHLGLGGQTPKEVYHGRRAANRKPRLEPRASWPRGSPGAMPHANIRGKCGTKFALQVRFHAGQKQLPIVTLRRAA
jgi:transposase InsO family protein